MEESAMNIQWYPGHMTKTRRMISDQLKHMDAVCEILDARVPLSSRNPDVEELTSGKPRLTWRTRRPPRRGRRISAGGASPCWRPTPSRARA